MLGLAGDGRGGHPAANLALVRQDGSGGTMNWDQAWDVISSRTGIIEPDIFFQRLNNGGVLEKQIDTLKKASEQRLEALKKEVVVVEQDMEESRNLATFAAGPSNKVSARNIPSPSRASYTYPLTHHLIHPLIILSPFTPTYTLF